MTRRTSDGRIVVMLITSSLVPQTFACTPTCIPPAGAPRQMHELDNRMCTEDCFLRECTLHLVQYGMSILRLTIRARKRMPSIRVFRAQGRKGDVEDLFRETLVTSLGPPPVLATPLNTPWRSGARSLATWR